jgi:hypothetical protein
MLRDRLPESQQRGRRIVRGPMSAIERRPTADTLATIAGDEINRLSRVSVMLERSIPVCPALIAANSYVKAAIEALEPVTRIQSKE